MKRAPFAILLLLSAGLAIAGCQCGTVTSAEFDRRYPYGRGRLFTTTGIVDLQGAIGDLVGSDLGILDLTIHPDSASLEVLHQNGFDRDYYYYRNGSFGKRQPQQASVHDIRTGDVIAPENIPWNRLTELVRAAPTRLEIQDGRVRYIDVDRTEVRLRVEGERRAGTLSADHTGAITGAKLD